MSDIDIGYEIGLRFKRYSRVILRRRRLFYAVILFPLLFTILFTTIMPPSYKAFGRLLPTGDASGVGMLGFLTGFFGSSGGITSEGLPSSFLYADILKSRTVIEGVLKHEYEYYRGNKFIQGDLYDLKNWPRNNKAVENFRKSSGIKMDLETGLITINAKAREPELAAQIINVWIDNLDHFNREVRVTNARENLEYLEKRVEESRIELEAIKDTLVEFLSQNRGYNEVSSPEVENKIRMMENRRTIKERLYGVLLEEQEMARLSKQKTTPVISVLDTAVPPAEKDSPKRIPVFLLSLVITLIIAGIILLILEVKEPTSFEEWIKWNEIKSALIEDMRDFKNLFRKSGGKSAAD